MKPPAFLLAIVVLAVCLFATVAGLVSCQNPTPQQSLIMDRAGQAVLIAINYAEARGKIDPVDAELARTLGTIVLPPAPVAEAPSGK